MTIWMIISIGFFFLGFLGAGIALLAAGCAKKIVALIVVGSILLAIQAIILIAFIVLFIFGSAIL